LENTNRTAGREASQPWRRKHFRTPAVDEPSGTPAFGNGNAMKSFSHIRLLVTIVAAVMLVLVGDAESPKRRILDLPVTSTEGEWSAGSVELSDTEEAAWSIRMGDIDNMNAGWRIAFNPFKGGRARELPIAWETNVEDSAGTDRVMVIRGSRLGDEFSTHAPQNDARIEPVTMNFLPPQIEIGTLHLQCFVSGLDQRSGGTPYSLLLNGQSFPEIDEQLRALDIPDRQGAMLTLRLPRAAHSLMQSGRVELVIDASEPAAANGYAFDFVRLLINVRQFTHTGSIIGTVRDGKTATALNGARISAQGRTTTTDRDGRYRLDGIAAGVAVLIVEPPGLARQLRAVELTAGGAVEAFFACVP
jgi:hypothetical protein